MAHKTEVAKTERVVRVHNTHREGYRRGGKAHPLGTTEHSADAFTPDQIDALKADPRLSVSVVEKPAPAAPAPDQNSPGAKT